LIDLQTRYRAGDILGSKYDGQKVTEEVPLDEQNILNITGRRTFKTKNMLDWVF